MFPALFLAVVVAAEPKPLAIDMPSVDRGELNANKPLVQTFRLKNTGAVPITITDVAGLCGCFRHELTAKVIEPGKTIDLVIGINLLTQPEGPNTWKMLVRYRVDADPPTTGERLVQIAAKVRKEVSVEPVALMMLSEKAMTGTLTVIDRRGKPLTVTTARIGLKDVKTEVKPAIDAGGRRTQKVEITVGDACPAGQYADEICIDTDDPEYRELRIPVRVVKKSAASGVRAVPESATLRFAKEQTSATTLLRLRDAENREVVVEKAEADHPAITCKWAAGPGQMATLRVTVDRSKANALGLGVITVRVKGPAAETIVIPVSWTLP
jgi:hypothetical protein